jgi:hypothetical protein
MVECRSTTTTQAAAAAAAAAAAIAHRVQESSGINDGDPLQQWLLLLLCTYCHAGTACADDNVACWL